MADVMDENINEMNQGEFKEKAKQKIRENKKSVGIGAGAATAAALIGTGYMIGKKRAESRSTVHKIKSQLGL